MPGFRHGGGISTNRVQFNPYLKTATLGKWIVAEWRWTSFWFTCRVKYQINRVLWIIMPRLKLLVIYHNWPVWVVGCPHQSAWYSPKCRWSSSSYICRQDNPFPYLSTIAKPRLYHSEIFYYSFHKTVVKPEPLWLSSTKRQYTSSLQKEGFHEICVVSSTPGCLPTVG